jgi:lipopolysaccharide/colanic/teichoic acid biosynthesis glycosyltransferase
MDRLSGARAAQFGAEFLLPPRRAKLRFRLQLSLFLFDAFALSASVSLAGFIWHRNGFGSNGAPMAAAFIASYCIVGANAGIFASDNLANRRRSVLVGMRSVLFASAGIILAAFFLKAGAQISRMELAISGMLGVLLVGLERTLFTTWALRRFGPRLQTEIVIVDDVVVEPPAWVHLVDAATLHLSCDLGDPLMLDRIGRLVASVDRVVIACPPERRRNWAMVMKGANTHAEILSPELTQIGPLGTAQFGDQSTVIVSAGSLDLRQRCIKRCLDLALSGGALLLFFPVLIVVAVAIKLDSSGPVFFVQDRVGRGNRLFGIYKFRSMHVDATDSSGSRSASRGDHRVTRVGRIIRATSIDELPQLFNVLKGEMSFVGPRPHALGSLAGDLLFWEVDERYWHRHVCKPGMTGLAQIRGYRGATHRVSDLADRLQADLEYVAGWTVLRDISILFATLRVVVHRNAY